MDESNLNEVKENTDRKRVKIIDRVTLGSAESVLVQGWVTQLKESTSGYLDIAKSDVVNFLIRQHAASFSGKEIKSIRNAHYDPVRHLSWIMPRLKEALAKGDSAQVTALQREIRGIELSIVGNANGDCEVKKPRKPRRKKSVDGAPDAPLEP